MLDKLLKNYKDSSQFEIGDGFISAFDKITFAALLDKRFQGFTAGHIENADLKRLIEAESFGCEKDVIWVENEGKRDWIKIYRGIFLKSKVDARNFGKPTFTSEGLVKAIKKTKVSEANYLGFEGSKAQIFDSDWNVILEMDVPYQFEREYHYNLGLVKKFLKMKNTNPEFSIVEFGGRTHALRLHWDDFDMYIANLIKDNCP